MELNIGTGNQDLTTGARTLQGATNFGDIVEVDVKYNTTTIYTNEISTTTKETIHVDNARHIDILNKQIEQVGREIEKVPKDKIAKLQERKALLAETLNIYKEQLAKEEELAIDKVTEDVETHEETSTIIKQGAATVVIKAPAQKHLDLASLQAFYNENGKDAQKTYQHLLDHINQYKDDPEVLQHTISALLGDMGEHYDDSKNHVAPGKNIVDQLEKIINLGEGEQLKGLMCESIHYTVMKALNDCGIEAVTIGGGTKSQGIGTNHATLLYKNSKGEYVSCNYGDYKVVQADNILDATKEVYKNVTDDILITNGTITIQDENNMYQTYALEDVAAFGSAVADKGLFSKPGVAPIFNNNNVTESYDNKSGNQTLNVDVTFVNQEKPIMQTFSLQGLKIGESDIANQSESAGAKYQNVFSKNLNDKTKLFVDNIAIVSNTSLTNTGNSANITTIRPQNISHEDLLSAGQEVIAHLAQNDSVAQLNNTTTVSGYKVKLAAGNEFNLDEAHSGLYNGQLVRYSEADQIKTIEEQRTLNTLSSETKTNVDDVTIVPTSEPRQPEQAPTEIKTNLTTMADIAKVGVQTELVNTGDVKVEGISQATVRGNLVLGNGVGGQASVTLEQGVTAQMKPTENLTLSADASAGLVLTGAEHNNYEGIFLQPGFKGTAGVGLDWKPNEHLDLSTSLSGGILTDAASTQTAYTVGAQVNYKPGQDAPTIFAGGQYTAQHEQLHLGNFDEAIRDNNNLRIQLGTKFKNNSQLSIDYNKYNDALHKNQNSNSWMMTYKRTFGGK